jgi:predicted dehydrogenase
MKQVIQDLRSRTVQVEDVPPPRCLAEGVLVKTAASLISAGTERAIIRLGGKSLFGKALERPDLVARFYRRFKTAGAKDALAAVRARLQTAIALGYSSSGLVLEVGNGADEFVPGDRVACAGAGHAGHAEINWIPKNLCAKVPSGVDLEEAATATMGAIAMQAVRVAEAKLGERVAVIGLGLVGQIVAQILHAAGCTVWGLDIDPERVRLARQLGADFACECSNWRESPWNDLVSRGRGMDAVIIAASSRASAPVELAGRLARDQGVVVLLGDVRAHIPREPYYAKELQVRYSRSLGPGRYDPVYEERGLDYPYGFVRWTEKRNLEAYLDLLAGGKLSVLALLTHRFLINEASQAYHMLSASGQERPLGILFSYPDAEAAPRMPESQAPGGIVHPARDGSSSRSNATSESATWRRQSRFAPDHSARPGAVRIGWIGAGSFSRTKLLPALRRMNGIEWVGVANRTGISAKRVAQDFGFRYAVTDAGEVLNDPAIDAVFIATRHDLHAGLVRSALERGKHVFVEKPLCVNERELDDLASAYARSQSVLSVGFNRRFSPFAAQCARFFQGRREPLTVLYRVNAGPLDRTHWIFDPEHGGGPTVGEVCHFVDLAIFLTSSVPSWVQAGPLPRSKGAENGGLQAQIEFADGSQACIFYVLSGDVSVAKERIEVFGGSRTAISDDFRCSWFYRNGRCRLRWALCQDKGHRNELGAFIQSVSKGREAPIPFSDLYAATLTTFRIREALASGKAKKVMGDPGMMVDNPSQSPDLSFTV